ncbi:unnamed protein product [Staurois parvus]|uniref:Uncharacterized protein n=1 Tax=Staurois parvus TaxID=386267 RepID=A0ABN9B382_9NEOB|nr:unnamed protein product [Staurois parvus]
MTEQGQRMLKRIVQTVQLSAKSIAKDIQTSCGLQISTTQCVEIFMEWVSMNGATASEALHHQVLYKALELHVGVKHTTTGL